MQIPVFDLLSSLQPALLCSRLSAGCNASSREGQTSMGKRPGRSAGQAATKKAKGDSWVDRVVAALGWLGAPHAVTTSIVTVVSLRFYELSTCAKNLQRRC